MSWSTTGTIEVAQTSSMTFKGTHGSLSVRSSAGRTTASPRLGSTGDGGLLPVGSSVVGEGILDFVWRLKHVRQTLFFLTGASFNYFSCDVFPNFSV